MNFSVMHDIETLSKSKNAVILSIGACKFNDKEIIDTFYINIDPKDSYRYGLHISHETLDWWKNQRPEAYEALKKDRVPLAEALERYSEWYGPKSVWTWGNGAEFDNTIIESSYLAVDKQPPWKYYDSMCYRTVVNLTGSRLKANDVNRVGVLHNALDDAKSQTLNLIRVLNKG